MTYISSKVLIDFIDDELSHAYLICTITSHRFQLYIYEYSTDMKGATIQVIGIERGNGTTLTRSHNISAINTTPVIVTSCPV